MRKWETETVTGSIGPGLVPPRKLLLVVLDELTQIIGLVKQPEQLLGEQVGRILTETVDRHAAALVHLEVDLVRHVLRLLELFVLLHEFLHLLLHGQQLVQLGRHFEVTK